MTEPWSSRRSHLRRLSELSLMQNSIWWRLWTQVVILERKSFHLLYATEWPKYGSIHISRNQSLSSAIKDKQIKLWDKFQTRLIYTWLSKIYATLHYQLELSRYHAAFSIWFALWISHWQSGTSACRGKHSRSETFWTWLTLWRQTQRQVSFWPIN